MLTLFNLGDCSGRFLGGKLFMHFGRVCTLVGSYVRVIFFPTFLLILFVEPPHWLFGADWFKMLNTFALGLTNGFFATLCAILAPMSVPEETRPQTGAFVSVGIILGITIGVALAIPMGQVIAASPFTN